MMMKSISGFTMKSLFSVIRSKQGKFKSNPFSVLPSSAIHTSNEPILRHSDLDYAFHSIENVGEAESLFRYMLQMKPTPHISDYNKLYSVLVKMEHYSQVILMFKERSLLGYGVDGYSMNTLINCYAHLKEVELGFPTVAHFLKQGYPPDIVGFNCFIKGFFLKGNVAEAVGLFKNLVKNKSDIDEITIATVLDGLSKSGSILEAVDLLLISEKNDWKLNVFCYSIVLDGLSKSRMLKDVMELLNRMSDRGILPDVVTYNILLHGLCTHDKHDFACSIFNDLPSKGITPVVVTYNVLINGFCHHGLFLEAKDMLESMERLGCFPDSFTYNIIVRGCLQLHHRHNIHSIDLLRRIIGRDFQLAAATFFLLLGQVEVLRQMHNIYDDDVINQLIQKLILSCPMHQLRDKVDEFIMSNLMQKLIR